MRRDVQRSSTAEGPPRWVTRVMVVVAGGLCLLVVFVALLDSAPLGIDYEKESRQLLDKWADENGVLWSEAKRLGVEEGWKLYARNGGISLGTFSIGDLRYSPMYSPPGGRRIVQVSAPRGNRLAFTECTQDGTDERYVSREFELCVLESTGAVTKVRLDDKPVESYRVKHALALGDHSLLCVTMEGAYIFETESKALQRIPQLPREELDSFKEKKALLVDGEFLVLVTVGLKWVDCDMFVLAARAPYGVLRRIEGVRDAIVLGQELVLRKQEGCFLYRPRTGEAEYLASGQLSVPVSDEDFLLYTDDGIYRYNVRSRSTAAFWSPRPRTSAFRLGHLWPKSYRYDRLILSPDESFLFVPWEFRWGSGAKGWMEVLEYEIYEVKTPEKKGAFLQPHLGRFPLELLGWAQNQCPTR